MNLHKDFEFLFHSISSEEMKLIQKEVVVKQLSVGEVLIKEGEKGNEIYLVANGKLGVVREGLSLSHLSKGAIIGEAAFFDEEIRSASVIAQTTAEVYQICIDKLSETIKWRLLKNIAKYLFQRQKESNFDKIEGLKRLLHLEAVKHRMAVFVFYIIVGLCVYFFLLKLIAQFHFNPGFSTALSIPLILLVFLFIFIIIRKCQLPSSMLGLNMKEWRSSLKDAAWVSALVCGIITIGKWVLCKLIGVDEPLFGVTSPKFREIYFTSNNLIFLWAYILFCPMQEFMARGCMQTMLYEFFSGKRKNFFSILVSNSLFGALHLDLSVTMAFVIYLIGFCWGWMYSRHRTLLGVSLSHIIIGVYGGWILGYV